MRRAPRRLQAPDLILIVGFGSVAALLCLALAPLWPPSLFADAGPWAWLRSSTPVGPSVLAPLAWLWPAYAAAVGISPVLPPAAGVSRVLAPFAALWLAGLYSLLRVAGHPRSRAVVLASLAAAGAGAGLFVGLPGADPVGAVVTVLLLLLVAGTETRAPRWFLLWPAAGLGLSTSVTSGACALVLACRGGWRRSCVNLAGAAAVAAVLVSLPLPQPVEVALAASPSGPLRGATGLGAAMAPVRGLVVPPLRLVPDEDLPDWWRLRPDAGRGTVRPWALDIGLSLALVGLAGAGLAAGGSPRLRVAVALGLAGEAAWAALEGFAPPGGALRTAPLLVVLIGFGLGDPWRRARRALLLGALALTAVISLERLTLIGAAARSAATPREQVLFEMRRRPAGPWPRGLGHALLAEPGTGELDKTYREPGGSFSPAASTFGVSVWVTNSDGVPVSTSDTLPLSALVERLERNVPAPGLPAVVTTTPLYRAALRRLGPRHVALDVTWEASVFGAALVVRSVGPAGGPVRSLRWTGSHLRVNDRWQVTVTPAPLRVFLGDERAGWKGTGDAAPSEWADDAGWGFARLALCPRNPLTLEVRDTRAAAHVPTLPPVRGGLRLDLPDPGFTESLLAQRDHLLMGLVGREARPGDPIAYAAPWLRDSAYVVVALAHAGELAVARSLAEALAKHDYFGGAGPEADSCGLAIWALEEVAIRIDDRAYDRVLWPDVRRKAECIEALLSARGPVQQALHGPLLPQARRDPEAMLVADAARDGLIVGRMDAHRPVLYVNAVAYRGLQDAARLAERLVQTEAARRWRTRAAALQEAWERAMGSRRLGNARTFIAGLWPSGIADRSRSAYENALEERWRRRRDVSGGLLTRPAWTYFEVAETHQWLRLGRIDRVQASLEWFRANQTSPGLFTWWEGGVGEPADPWGRWPYMRGWVRPPCISPHYWTAAEMALLQMDMLAYSEEADGRSAIVVGAGVPAEWLKYPLQVRGLSLPHGRLDWEWNGRRMRVTLQGPSPQVLRLGQSFPADTPLQVETAPHSRGGGPD